MTDEIGQPYQVMPAKRSYDRLDYGIDWEGFLERRWRPNQVYTAGVRVRPAGLRRQAEDRGAGFEYECTTGGSTSSREPLWPETIGATVTNGTVTWTCRARSTSSLVTTVSSSEWVTESPGVTLSGPELAGLLATVVVAGGTSGATVQLLNRVQLANGQRKEGRLDVPVRD